MDISLEAGPVLACIIESQMDPQYKVMLKCLYETMTWGLDFWFFSFTLIYRGIWVERKRISGATLFTLSTLQ